MPEFTSSQIDFISLVNNFWILLFVLFFLVPQFQLMALNSARRGLLKRISKLRGSQVITLIHRQETIAFFGIPISRFIDIDDSEEVLRAIRMAPKDAPIDLIIHTPGGIALAAAQIALALNSHPGKKTVIVPHYAMSGGTLIALAADEIIMDPFAVLGPVDPQFVEGGETYPAASLLKVLERKKIDDVEDRTIILAEEARKAITQMEELVCRILIGRYPKETVERVCEELVSGKYTHDHPITAQDVINMGLNVSTNVPEEIYQLMSLYKMGARVRRPGVEFVPVMPSVPRRESPKV